ncbi:unnamed protein product [Acanthosepion pharaonis]|uniref:Uncharacterized protein n=1 Tax=Acanthosepion pharaonis TaxID=158019 RepID=A0A812DUH1_ACAPH|nr:unnamed protein product [Sepia pharaonis]
MTFFFYHIFFPPARETQLRQHQLSFFLFFQILCRLLFLSCFCSSLSPYLYSLLLFYYVFFTHSLFLSPSNLPLLFRSLFLSVFPSLEPHHLPFYQFFLTLPSAFTISLFFAPSLSSFLSFFINLSFPLLIQILPFSFVLFLSIFSLVPLSLLFLSFVYSYFISFEIHLTCSLFHFFALSFKLFFFFPFFFPSISFTSFSFLFLFHFFFPISLFHFSFLCSFFHTLFLSYLLFHTLFLSYPLSFTLFFFPILSLSHSFSFLSSLFHTLFSLSFLFTLFSFLHSFFFLSLITLFFSFLSYPLSFIHFSFFLLFFTLFTSLSCSSCPLSFTFFHILSLSYPSLLYFLKSIYLLKHI